METIPVLDLHVIASVDISPFGAPSDGRVLDDAGAMKSSRSLSTSNEPERPKKHARTALKNDCDAQAGLTVTRIIDAAWKAMERAVAPRDERIIDNEHRTHEILI